MAKKQKPLTEEDWDAIFLLRCRSKRGEELTREQFEACMRAHKENPKRYGAMEKKVFEATKPFGADLGINMVQGNNAGTLWGHLRTFC